MIRVDMLGDKETRAAFLRIAKELGNDKESNSPRSKSTCKCDARTYASFKRWKRF